MDQTKALRFITNLSKCDMPSENKEEMFADILSRLVESNTLYSHTATKTDVCDEGIKVMNKAVKPDSHTDTETDVCGEKNLTKATKQALINLNINEISSSKKIWKWHDVYDEVKKILGPHTVKKYKDFEASVRWEAQPMLRGYSLCKF